MRKGVVSLPDVGSETLASVGTANPNPTSPTLGSRRFSQADFAGPVEHGVWTLNQGSIGESPSQIAVSGTVDVVDQDLDLSFSAAGEAHTDPRWTLRVAGPWSGPSVWRKPLAVK